MPNIGTLDSTLNIDFRKAEGQYRRFQSQINRSFNKTNPFAQMAGGARDFDKALGSATNRVVAFGAAAVIFNTLSSSVRAFVASMVEVDKSLTEINVNLNQSGEGLKKFGADLFNIARQTGQTFQTAAQAATELSRQGLSMEETLKRTNDALILSRRTGMSAADSVETLTAAINSFNKEAIDSSQVLNKFVAVDTKFAVSARDLSEAVSRVGSTAQEAGVGIDELIGLVTSLQQTTALGGANIGNGLKTIFTRVRAAPETISSLESIGVAIKNTDGSLRSAIQILQDYTVAREKMGEAERAVMDRTIGGTFQINKLQAALRDVSKEYGIFANASKTAANASDEAYQSNKQLNESLASLFNTASVSIKQLVSSVGNQGIGPVLGNIIKAVEGARSYLSGDTGEKMGKSLGEGMLSGLTNVITGPVMLGLIALLGGTIKRVLGTFKEEAKTLFQSNSAASARAKIQERINELYRAGTVAEQAELNTVTSIVRQKEILLGIQARLNRELLIGTELQNSFLTSRSPLSGGGFRPSPQLSRNAQVPIFADPLKSAIGREIAAGAPPSSIYVDKDPRVATVGNPMGLLVANRRDEPLGGFQGVSRVIAQGGNPKTAGRVPNFAAPRRNPFDAEEVETQQIIKKLNDESKKFGNSLNFINIEFKKVAKTLSEEYPYGPQKPIFQGPADPSDKILKDLEISRLKSAKRAKEFAAQEERLVTLRAKLQKSTENVLEKAEKKRLAMEKNRYPSPIGPTNPFANMRIIGSAGGTGAGGLPASAFPMSPQQQQNAAAANAYIGGLQGGGIDPVIAARSRRAGSELRDISFQNLLSGTSSNVGRGGVLNRRQMAEFEQRVKKQILSSSEFKGLKLSEIEGDKNLRGLFLERQNAIIDPIAASNTANRERRVQEYLGNKRANRERRVQDELAKKEEAKALLAQRRQNRAFVGSFVLPMAAGFVDPAFEYFGAKTGGGTTGGMVSGALKGAGQGASLGVFGPIAGGIGAAVGALIGGFSKIKKSTEELAAEFDKAATQRAQEGDALSRAMALQEQIKDAVRGGESPEVVSKLQDRLRDTRSEIRDSRKLDILDIVDEGEKQRRAERESREDQRLTAFGKIKTALSRGEFGDDLPRQIMTALEGVDINLTDDTLAKIAGGDYRRPIAPFSQYGQPTSIQEGMDFAKKLSESEKSFAEAVDKFAPFAEKIGVRREDISRDNLRDLAMSVYKAFGQRNEQNTADAERRKRDKEAAGSSGFGKGMFLASPNTDIFRQASLTGRSPNAGRTERARASFEMYQEMERLGAPVAPNARTKQATAQTQVGNAADAYISFLSGAGYNVSQLKDRRGDPNIGAIERLMTHASKSGGKYAADAKSLLPGVGRMGATLDEAGVKRSDGSFNGFELGADYGAFAKGRKRGDPGKYVTKDTLSFALQGRGGYAGVDAKGNPIATRGVETPFLSMDTLRWRNAQMSEEFGKGKRNVLRQEGIGATVQTPKTADVAGEASAKERAPVQINVNIDGALDLISKGMDADLAVMMNTAVNKAVVDTASQYFADIQPQLTALNAQVAAINGKPLPPKVGRDLDANLPRGMKAPTIQTAPTIKTP